MPSTFARGAAASAARWVGQSPPSDKPPHGHRLPRPPLRARPPAVKVALAYQPATTSPGNGQTRTPCFASAPRLAQRQAARAKQPRSTNVSTAPSASVASRLRSAYGGKVHPGTANAPRRAPSHRRPREVSPAQTLIFAQYSLGLTSAPAIPTLLRRPRLSRPTAALALRKWALARPSLKATPQSSPTSRPSSGKVP